MISNIPIDRQPDTLSGLFWGKNDRTTVSFNEQYQGTAQQRIPSAKPVDYNQYEVCDITEPKDHITVNEYGSSSLWLFWAGSSRGIR